jgi:hypothetical protein
MAKQMILESWESDEAQDWEADEAIAESDESAEDIGEAARRRKGGYSPGRGIRGMTLSGPEGARKFSFPASVATTAETNRGLANQELARRSLEERLERFERRLRAQQKSELSATGLAFLAVGGGLTVWSLVKASEQGFTFNGWASQESAAGAAVLSANQLAATAARSAMTGGGYRHTTVSLAADIAALTQLAAFAFGNLYTPSGSGSLFAKPPIVLDDADLSTDGLPALQSLKPNDIVVTRQSHHTAQIITDSKNNSNTYRYVE